MVGLGTEGPGIALLGPEVASVAVAVSPDALSDTVVLPEAAKLL